LDDNSECECNIEPIGWEKGTWEIDRSVNIGGVFSHFTVGSLRFVGNGAKFLRDIWESKGFNGRCDLHIYWYKFLNQSYVEFPSALNINFACKPRVKVGRFAIGIEVEAINNETKVKLDNRKKTDVDITKLVSLGRYSIVDYGEGIMQSLPKNINIPALSEFNTAGWNEYSGIESWMLGMPSQNSYTSVPLNITYSEFTEAQYVGYVTRATSLSSLTPILRSVSGVINLTVLANISINVLENYNQDYWTAKFIATDNTYGITAEVEVCVFGNNRGIQNFIDTGNITVPDNGNLYFVIEVGQRSDVKAIMLGNPSIAVSQEVANTEAVTVEGFPIYECFERVLQHCLDNQFPFYSEYLGRQDVVYNLVGDKYLTENQLRFFSFLSGLGFRGSQLGDINNPMSLNFEKLFNSSSAILNLGYIIQLIEGFNRVRVEEYSWFFDDTVVLDLSDRIKFYDIEIESMPELAYQRIKTGYDNFVYEVKNGRGEYNTTQQRTTIINTDSEFDNVSKIRADMTEMIKLIEKPITENGSEDMGSDNHIFVLKTQRDTDEWKPEMNENIVIENDSSIYGDLSFNLYISPLRNLLRNGNKIKSALTKFLESFILFQTSDKSQTLKTTGEGITITENEDILVDSVDDPIYLPEKATVTCDITKEELNSLFENLPNGKPKLCGIIKFTDEITGYWLNGKIELKGKKITISILKKYV